MTNLLDRNRILLITLALTALFASVTVAQDKSRQLKIARAEANPANSKVPCGWIYAYDRGKGEPDLCVYIWPNQTWTMAAESQPGLFDRVHAKGKIKDGIAVGFPVADLEKARNLYRAGRVAAELNGVEIKTRSR